MFGKIPQKKQFSFTTLKSVRPDKNKPLRERMDFSSYSSFGRKPARKKMIIFIILLLIVLAFILNYGLNSAGTKNIKVNENELEKVNG